MEKVSIIFSILTHDQEFMSIFWAFASLPVGIWHIFYFHSNEQLTEKKLVEISSEFEGVDGANIGLGVLVMCFLVAFPLIVVAPKLDSWSLQRYGMKFYPIDVMFGVGYGIYQGVFALIKNVYPMAKSLSYVYEYKAKIHRIAKYQILTSIFMVILVVLFFFATVQANT